MLPTYSQAYKEIRDELSNLAKKLLNIHKDALEAFKQKDVEKLGNIALICNSSFEQEANAIDNKIVVIFARYEPEANILRELLMCLKITTEIVRIGNRATAYARLMKEHIVSGFDFSSIDEYVIQLHTSAIKAVEYAINWDDDVDYEQQLLKTKTEESKTDDIYSILQKEIFSLLKTMNEITESSLKILNSVKKLERVADHASNIASLMQYAKHGGKISLYQ